MKITIFTSNQSRHVALINRLATISDKTFAVIECNTVFPGRVEDFYKKSKLMSRYFESVQLAEKRCFGDLSFTASSVSSLILKSGDLNLLTPETLGEALDSDIYIVFGASYIKGWLVDYLIARRAINIHMGLSPYYRGSSCNFWALYDNKPEYVGSTIHLLSKGLDNGPILYHALPQLNEATPFEFTMNSVIAAQISLVDRIANGELFQTEPLVQNLVDQIRYSRNSEFTDDVVASYFARNISNRNIQERLSSAVKPILRNPYFLNTSEK
jgi:hypothetical protein